MTKVNPTALHTVNFMAVHKDGSKSPAFLNEIGFMRDGEVYEFVFLINDGRTIVDETLFIPIKLGFEHEETRTLCDLMRFIGQEKDKWLASIGYSMEQIEDRYEVLPPHEWDWKGNAPDCLRALQPG